MTAIETATPAATFRALALAEIHESPWNPRKHYDAAQLQELAESLQSTGQLTPVLVRPQERGGYELAAGHRRYRAAKLAGLETLDAIVRAMDDPTFLEVLVIENDHREDLHPLEEAQGFEALLRKGGYDVAKIAHRIGRSIKYVYDRLKLLELVPEAKKLFREGTITAGHAIILARLAKEHQAKAIESDRSGNGRIGGLFVHEHTLFDPRHEDDEALEREPPRKLVSVREFQAWVDEHVRFDPTAADPMLFPETVQEFREAQSAKEKIVKITFDYRVNDEARDEHERTYGHQAWKRADGREGSTPCEYAVLGIVVAGPGRGEAFDVCVNKKKCSVHWAAEQRAAAKRTTGTNRSAATRDDWLAKQRAEQARAEAERKRWEQAAPEILKAARERIQTGRVHAESPIGKLLLGELARGGRVAKPLEPRGDSPEAFLRQLAYLVIAGELNRAWGASRDWPRLLKPFGVDPTAIRDRVAPEEKPAAVQTSGKPKAKGKKKLAGDVRRATAKARAKAKKGTAA